jgi:hypothetical protein
MLFSTQIVAIMAMSIAGTQAFPSSPAPAIGDIEGDLKVVHIERRAAGDLTFYADADPEAALARREASDLTARATCTNEIKSCNGQAGAITTYRAPKDRCQELLAELEVSNDKLPSDPRSICLGGDKNGKCCVSWNTVPNRVNELKRKDIWRPASLIYGACDDHSLTSISGRDISSGPYFDGCITVCLSKRPGGCN